jgi:hypothetical protein
MFTGADENTTEEEAIVFGGIAGVALDQCYHQACDNVTNLNTEAFELHAKVIAAPVATYSLSWEVFPARNVTATKRSVPRRRKAVQDRYIRSKPRQRAQPMEK